MMGQSNAKRSPIQYNQPVNSLRQGGDVTTINTVGNLTPEQRIEIMAGRLWEKNEAQSMATRKSAASIYDRMFAQRDFYDKMSGKYKTQEFEPDINYGFAGSIKPSNQQQLQTGNRIQAAAKAAYDTGNMSYYQKAFARYPMK